MLMLLYYTTLCSCFSGSITQYITLVLLIDAVLVSSEPVTTGSITQYIMPMLLTDSEALLVMQQLEPV